MSRPVPRVSVIVVNWNGRHHLEACLQALAVQTAAPHEVIVVDNGSSDNSRAYLEGLDWPWLKTRYLPENTGFSGGNNAALPLVSGDIIALINNDAVAAPRWIEAALSAFEDAGCGMVACKILRYSDPGRIDKAGHLIYRDGLNRGRGTGQPATGMFQRRGEALWPDGCAAFFRKSVIDEIGFFDPDYYLYGEDADLGFRVRWAGYGCIYEPGSEVRHHHSSALGKFSPKKVYYVERNRIWTLVKNFPASWILLSPFFTALRFVMNGVSMLSGRGSAAGFRGEHSSATLLGVLLKASWHGLLGVPLMLRKRKKVLRRKTFAEMKKLLRQHLISAREITLSD